ncbi:MAG: hypothetical protein IPM98_04015 [Lewinellaceae bacterium]|nr:hypothetical protein [Lewinellaceae bacterium]
MRDKIPSNWAPENPSSKSIPELAKSVWRAEFLFATGLAGPKEYFTFRTQKQGSGKSRVQSLEICHYQNKNQSNKNARIYS